MLISREELRFDFKTARFELKSASDRKILGWIFDQFLYGEVTGIQCGYWLHRAPNLNAAVFLARQATEELSHFRKILRIFTILGEKPNKAHWVVRFLATGMMSGSWGEHVAIEMAIGEGLVLSLFYALADTIEDPEIQKIIGSAIPEEEKHVEFGERETQAWLVAHPRARNLLLSQAWVQYWALKRLKKFALKKLVKELGSDHSIVLIFESFYLHLIYCFELRIERLKLSELFLSQLSAMKKLSLWLLFPILTICEKLRPKGLLLTQTYLEDPVLRTELQKSLFLPSIHE